MTAQLEKRLDAVRFIDALAESYSGRKRAPRILPRAWKTMLAAHAHIDNRDSDIERLLPAQFIMRDATQQYVISRCGEDYIELARCVG